MPSYGLPSDVNELQEYSSLLRALKYSGAIDVDPLVLGPPVDLPEPGYEDEDDDDVEAVRGDSKDEPDFTSGPCGLEQYEEKPGPKGSSLTSLAQTALDLQQNIKRRRWPLMADELPSMEWDLRGEIARFAYHTLLPSDLEEDGMENNAAIRAVTLSTLDHLAEILNCIAVFNGPNAPRVKERLRPMGWQSILDIVEVHGAVNVKLVSYFLFLSVTVPRRSPAVIVLPVS
jgi:hypothetical protein